MNIRTVVAGVRPVSPVLSVAALLAGLLAAGPGAAWAEGRITFTKATVQGCNAMGKCIWQVSCRVGPNGDVTQEVRGVSRDIKPIDKSFDVRSFPVKVDCKLALDDGWFTTSWKEMGSASLAVPGGGDYDIVMENKEKGGVSVHLTVDSLEVGAPAAAPAAATAKGTTAKVSTKPAAKPAAAKAPRQWLGVYQGGQQGAAVLVGLPWDQFKARAAQLDAQGSRVVAIDTYMDGGRRLWNGIFRSGKEKQELVAGLDWDAFSKKWKNLVNDQHMRLVDLVLYDEGSKRLVAGAFREGYDENTLWVGQEPKAFEAKWAELCGQGQRLVDMEVYKTTGDKINYAGAFRAGSGSYGLWTALDRDAFLAKWKKAGESTQINEVKTYTNGKKRLFDGVIGGGGLKTDVAMDLDWDAFAARWKEQFLKGKRLVDFQPYQD
jgi:hypothetical protein